MSDQPIEGALFTRNYIRPAQNVSDSVRARHRIAQLVSEQIYEGRFVKLVNGELGIIYPSGYGYMHEKFFKECSLNDFLSSITLLITSAKDRNLVFQFCERVLREEHLRYVIDAKGGVHFHVDENFERNVVSAIAGLGAPQYAAALHSLEQTLSEFSGPSPSGKLLIKGVFEAVESAFLVVINDPKANRLNSLAIDQHFKPILEVRYSTVPEKADKIERIIKLIKSWVDTAHPFRHGAPLDQIHEAPLDYAVFIADQGMAMLRLIVT